MSSAASLDLAPLEFGTLHAFRDWPNIDVPAISAGVYTVWDGTTLVYAGMAGRGLSADDLERHRAQPGRITGLRSRLASHASGRRSGDQFCVYVADRLVLPNLRTEEIENIAAARLSFDSLVRGYVHQRLSYRYLTTIDSVTAVGVENRVRRGELAAGAPLLNPLIPLRSRTGS